MCQYMLIIPTLTDVLRRIGVSTGLVGAIAGASDFASMFMTPGALLLPALPWPALGLCQDMLMAGPVLLRYTLWSLQGQHCLMPGLTASTGLAMASCKLVPISLVHVMDVRGGMCCDMLARVTLTYSRYRAAVAPQWMLVLLQECLSNPVHWPKTNMLTCVHAPCSSVCLHCAGYSVWTKYSFKMPVLAGALTCLMSNVLYVVSYQTRSLWLLVLSRFVLGFGTALHPNACRQLDQPCPHDTFSWVACGWNCLSTVDHLALV